MRMRVGQGIDVHPLVADRPLILGGTTIAHEFGLEGDSDGDVLTHAIIDAMLGAAGLGDIGTWFTVEEVARLQGSSIGMLEQVRGMVQTAGYQIGNVDATVVAQRPRLVPHVSAMREGLAKALRVVSEQISIKATTTDHLGALGRQEGIMALAVVLLQCSE